MPDPPDQALTRAAMWGMPQEPQAAPTKISGLNFDEAPMANGLDIVFFQH
jgi:hypothetical protein